MREKKYAAPFETTHKSMSFDSAKVRIFGGTTKVNTNFNFCTNEIQI